MTDAPKQTNGLTYADAGVSIDAGAALVDKIGPAATRTARAGVLGGLGGFGALFDVRAAGYDDPLLVAATDGVGTKLTLALTAGDLSGVGIDLVAMCVNDLLCQGAEPLFFLDYYATGALDPTAAATVVESVAEGCVRAGCALIGGETAEMPGLYQGAEFDLAGFAVGAVARDRVLPRQAEMGDAILALPASGAHSNGFSLIRKILEMSGVALEAPAPFAPAQTLGAALLTPTEIYVRPVLPLAQAGRVRALCHVTGGGLAENLPRVLPDGLAAEIDLSAWRRPALFAWLAETGGVAAAEMLRTFNCGVGLAIVVAEAERASVLAALAEAGAAPMEIGRVAPRAEGAPAVSFSGVLFP